MSTRSLNIIKKNDKLYFFHMQNDGSIAANTMLAWSEEDLKYVLKILSTTKNIAVSSVMTISDVKERLDKAYAEYVDALAKHNDYMVSLGRWLAYDVTTYDIIRYQQWETKRNDILMTFQSTVQKFGDVATAKDSSQILKRIAQLSKIPFCNDFAVVNYIDYDTETCRFETDYYVWNEKKQDYLTRKRTLSVEYTFEKVLEQGQRHAIGFREQK